MADTENAEPTSTLGQNERTLTDANSTASNQTREPAIATTSFNDSEAETSTSAIDLTETIPELRNRNRSTYSHTFVNDQEKDTHPKVKEPLEKEVMFECNICLDTASNPVVTMCGHLYCWPCLNSWLQANSPTSNQCPCCKSLVTRETVIPIYCRGQESNDPRYFLINNRKQPDASRPSGQRTNPPSRNPFANVFNIQFGFTPFGVNIVFQSN